MSLRIRDDHAPLPLYPLLLPLSISLDQLAASEGILHPAPPLRDSYTRRLTEQPPQRTLPADHPITALFTLDALDLKDTLNLSYSSASTTLYRYRQQGLFIARLANLNLQSGPARARASNLPNWRIRPQDFTLFYDVHLLHRKVKPRGGRGTPAAILTGTSVLPPSSYRRPVPIGGRAALAAAAAHQPSSTEPDPPRRTYPPLPGVSLDDPEYLRTRFQPQTPRTETPPTP